MDYHSRSRTKYKIEYHFVWVTKYHYQILQGDITLPIWELVRQVCERLEKRILRGVVGKNHAYILVSASPEIALSEIMRRIKGRTPAKMFEAYPTIRYWGETFLDARIFLCYGRWAYQRNDPGISFASFWTRFQWWIWHWTSCEAWWSTVGLSAR